MRDSEPESRFVHSRLLKTQYSGKHSPKSGKDESSELAKGPTTTTAAVPSDARILEKDSNSPSRAAREAEDAGVASVDGDEAATLAALMGDDGLAGTLDCATCPKSLAAQAATCPGSQLAPKVLVPDAGNSIRVPEII
ncbi:MAG: hypothetical protein GY811_28930 [Myxococcales bacterium]|nr:hypothetical protein [Myxococcales bacterium]